jgi:hypothetical protein
VGQASFERGDKFLGSRARIDYHAQHADHVEDPPDGPSIDRVDIEPAAYQIGSDIHLEIGEAEDEVGPRCEDFVDIRRSEGTHAWLFPAPAADA